MPVVGSIDQGTSSSRFLIFDSKSGKLLDSHQELIDQITPEQSWLEEDPEAIYQSVLNCVNAVVERQLKSDPNFKISCVGITNQRETTVVWDSLSGKALYNAILWCDGRTKSTVDGLLENHEQDALQSKTGLPISTYFSALKVKWLYDNVENVRCAIEAGTAMFGTIDTWLIYKLTSRKHFFTDATNASRTMFYDLNTNSWSPELLKFFSVPESLRLPKILPSSADFGEISDPEAANLSGVPITGVLGDQQAALVGQQCLSPGLLKCTYGTGCFLLQNTGQEKVFSKSGLLTTVAYQKADGQLVYALEGSIAIAGLLIRWLKDQLQIINSPKELNEHAESVTDSGGVTIVPAFGGLFCPYWDSSARGVICGLTQYSNKSHICRAALEAVAFQVKDVLEAMKADGQTCKALKADGGMTNSSLMMQIQADILGVPVVVPEMKESTALGAAAAAGCFLGVWEAKGWELFRGQGRDLNESGSSGERSDSRDSSEADSAIEEEQLKFVVTRPSESGGQMYDYGKWKLAVSKSQGWA